MHKSEGIGWKGGLVASMLGVTTGFGIANYDIIGKNMEKMADSVFIADSKFRDYKGEWEPYTVKTEDGKSPIWKVSRQCTKGLGANSEHWREQIKKYNESKGIKLGVVHVGDTLWVPKDCGCGGLGPYTNK